MWTLIAGCIVGLAIYEAFDALADWAEDDDGNGGTERK